MTQKIPFVRNKFGRIKTEQLLYRVFPHIRRDVRIDAGNGGSKTLKEQDVLKRPALRRCAVGSNIRAIDVLIACFFEKLDSELFDGGFGDFRVDRFTNPSAIHDKPIPNHPMLYSNHVVEVGLSECAVWVMVR